MADVQLLHKLEQLGLAKGNSVGCSGSTADSVAQSNIQSLDEGTARSDSEDDQDHSPVRSSDPGSASFLPSGSLPRRHRSSDSSSVPSAEASMIQAPMASSSAAPVSQQSALHYYSPHDGFGLGCPAPACFEERVNTAMGIYKKMDLRDGELGEHDTHASSSVNCSSVAPSVVQYWLGQQSRYSCACTLALLKLLCHASTPAARLTPCTHFRHVCPMLCLLQSPRCACCARCLTLRRPQ